MPFNLALPESRPLRYAIFGSVAWCLVPVLIVVATWGADGWKQPNNIGDFLAGVFAPLAFTWLAVAVVLQNEELKEQRKQLEQNGKALELQALELKRTVEELERQTRQMSAATTAALRSHKNEWLLAARRRLAERLILRLETVRVRYNRKMRFAGQDPQGKTTMIRGERVEVGPDAISIIKSNASDNNHIRAFSGVRDEMKRVSKSLPTALTAEDVSEKELSRLEDNCITAVQDIEFYRLETKSLPTFDEKDDDLEIRILNELDATFSEIRNLISQHYPKKHRAMET